eukprot:GILK01017660.1.p1 GENE.GILK01017660.1~~GILK01017660.1.p1  ORF type:complete len:100 (-),score=4.95 GILK01017660.1:184-483(-)
MLVYINFIQSREEGVKTKKRGGFVCLSFFIHMDVYGGVCNVLIFPLHTGTQNSQVKKASLRYMHIIFVSHSVESEKMVARKVPIGIVQRIKEKLLNMIE